MRKRHPAPETALGCLAIVRMDQPPEYLALPDRAGAGTRIVGQRRLLLQPLVWAG